jgi:tRNA dimethylallyltransferase
MQVAHTLDAEMVCMDSRQVYRGMDIATDKASRELRQSVPHHGLDTRNPDESYSAGQFGRDARVWIAEIRARGRVPLVVGGTGFFLRALTNPMFREPDMDGDRLEALRRHLGAFSKGELERWVGVLDPGRAAVAAEGGPHRLGRTLEVALLTGRPLSWWHAQGSPDQAPLAGVIVILELPREELDRRIDARVTRMAEEGLVAEVERLLEEGYGPQDPGMTGTGYREVAAYLAGDTTLEEALDRMRSVTRKYARRQLTWFRRQVPEDVIRIDAFQPVQAQAAQVVEAWRVASVARG